ncbi:MAG: sugar ABC transporter permease [Firmicutes bacterium]|nr:sugar ABC transporter permease [Bacillota bacterium]
MIQTKLKKRTKYGKEGVAGIFFAMTPILGFLIFGLAPMFLAVTMSFMDIPGYMLNRGAFVGFENYSRLFQMDQFWRSIRVTLVNGVTMPISLILALIVANFLNRNKVGTKLFRTVFFIPFVCSAVAVAMMWRWMFNTEFGIINNIITSFGGTRRNWLGNPTYVTWAMIISGVWGGMAFGILLFSAALHNVPKAYYEAAKIDGAGSVRQFFSVTLPGISPTMFFLVTLGIIGMLQDFTRFYVMLDLGAGNNAGLTAVFLLYRMAFVDNFTYGIAMASALSIVLAIGIIIVTRINFILSKWWVHYE